MERHPRSRRVSLFAALRLCVALLLLSSTVVAQDKQPNAERITYRVTGLFSADREKDMREAFAELADFKLVSVDFDAAEVTVEFAPAKLFPGQKPERVTELVSDKVRSVTHGTFAVKPRNTVPRDKLTEVEIAVAGHDCKACNLAAYEAVAALDGVTRAVVSLKGGKLAATIDPEKTDRAKLEEALKKKGVKVGKP